MKLIFTLAALFSIAVLGADIFSERDITPVPVDVFNLAARQSGEPCSYTSNKKDINGAIVYHIRVNKTLAGIPDDGPITDRQVQAVQNDVNTITSYLSSAITRLKGCKGPISAADCKKIVHICQFNLEPAVFDTLDEIAAHAPAFANAGLTYAICSDVDHACSLLQQFFSSLALKANPPCLQQLLTLASAFGDKCEDTHDALGCPS